MAGHDFSALYAQYLTIIAEMPDTFTSHQFILELAHQNQPQYIEALFSYRLHTHRGGSAPFRVVHGILAQRLAAHPTIIEQTRKDAPSIDIFGQDNSCSEWRKIS